MECTQNAPNILTIKEGVAQVRPLIKIMEKFFFRVRTNEIYSGILRVSFHRNLDNCGFVFFFLF